VTVTIQKLVEDGIMRPEHVALGELVAKLNASDDPQLTLAAALVSDQLARGHVCLDLVGVRKLVFTVGDSRDRYVSYDDWPAAEPWIEHLCSSVAVSVRPCADGGDNLDRPLVLDVDHARLYLARYWFFQQRLAAELAQRIAAAALPLDEDQLAAGIQRLFPDRQERGGRDQSLAAANAVDQRVAVITGGPGTGKTTTVAKLIALRLMQPVRGAAEDGTAKVLLMAPTGKAAQRLNESLASVTRRLDVDEGIREKMSGVQAGTIHRLLGWTPLPPERGGPFRHHAGLPLEADVVLVDEASMVDIGTMWRLFDAIRPEAQVILMGDRDQLASVEAGGVLADLCGESPFADPGRMSQPRRELLERRTGLPLPKDGVPGADPLADHVVNLRHSHRFDPGGGIGRLAASIREGDADGAMDALRRSDPDEIAWTDGAGAEKTLSMVLDEAVSRHGSCLELLKTYPRGSLEIVRHLGGFRVLCAHRTGGLGASAVNQRIAWRLEAAGLIDARAEVYAGCPIMVTRNDHDRRLFNGDVGLIVQGEKEGMLSGLFEDASAAEGCRSVPAVLLPATKPCYAMTIHKSQGSQFHEVMVVLPERPSPILSRELLYTAITRVADAVDPSAGERRPGRLHLVGSEKVIREAVGSRIRRTSGLRHALVALQGSATEDGKSES
jgi:exodeoxyribonuclease V alpha subunit